MSKLTVKTVTSGVITAVTDFTGTILEDQTTGQVIVVTS
jgi:hypothetical protein